MKIAMVAPLHESVPPRFYGGTERVVSYLTERLCELGHEVTLFASGESESRATLVPCSRRSLRLDPDCKDPVPHHLLMVERVASMASEFDIVHFHTDYVHFGLARRLEVPHVTTVHGRMDLRDTVPLYSEYREIPLVSISDSQRGPLKWANWAATIHHGLPPRLYPFSDRPEGYLAFLGRVSPEKGLDRAIRVAVETGHRLKIAAKIAQEDRPYFEAKIQPLLELPGVEFIGEIGEFDKGPFLANAKAVLFPIDWPEPFGLVMIESIACGTPVIAYDCGSVPEIMEDGVTGFVVREFEQAVEAVNRIDRIDRRVCRKTFERRFSDRRMAEDYVRVYEGLIDERRGARRQDYLKAI